MCAVARLGDGSRQDEGPSAGAGRETGSARVAGRDPCGSTSSGWTGCGLDGSSHAATRCRPRPRVVEWLDAEPHRTAKEIFDRLRREHPGMFLPGQLRTLQRRVQGLAPSRRPSSRVCRSDRSVPKALLHHRPQTPIRTTWLPTQRHRSRSGRSGPRSRGPARTGGVPAVHDPGFRMARRTGTGCKSASNGAWCRVRGDFGNAMAAPPGAGAAVLLAPDSHHPFQIQGAPSPSTSRRGAVARLPSRWTCCAKAAGCGSVSRLAALSTAAF